MTATVLERPAKNGPPQEGTNGEHAGGTPARRTPQPLWNGMRIPIILLSGEVNSGKSIMPIVTDPMCRPYAQGKFTDDPTSVCVWDQEGSVETYVGQLKFDWQDTRAAVFDGLHRRVVNPDNDDPAWRKKLLKTADVNDSPQESLFRAWYMSLLETPAKKYRVGSADTFTPLQDGMVSWLRRHPEAFGRTANQYSSASSMFLWPDAKAMLSYILSVDCRLRFETFFLTVHLKNEWKNSAKTGERIAEGLDVLDKLCTLHLRLDRKPESKKKSAPRLPSAIVMKQRLVKFGASEGDDKPILPPRIPECTPDAIRAYILNPPNFANLKAEERMPDDALTDDQKLKLQTEISENNRATAEMEIQIEAAKLSRLEKMKLAAQQQAAATAGGPVPETGTWTNKGKIAAGTATESQVREIKEQFPIVFADNGQIAEYLARYSVKRVAELSEATAADVLIELLDMASKARIAAAGEKLAASVGNAESSEPSQLITKPSPDVPLSSPPDDPNAEALHERFSEGSGSAPAVITDEQAAEIRSLLPRAFADNNEVRSFLNAEGIGKVAEMPASLFALVCGKLRQRALMRESGTVEKYSPPVGQSQASTATTGVASPNDFDISNEQLGQIRTLCEKAGWTVDQQQTWLKARGTEVRQKPYGSFREIKSSDAAVVIAMLAKIIDGFNGGVPGN